MTIIGIPKQPDQFGSDAGWNSATTPADGTEVEVFSIDNSGKYVVPFGVVFRDDKWHNAATGEELDAFVAGWRARPMREVA